MSIDKTTVWAYSEAFAEEPEHAAWARRVAMELGVDTISVGAGAFLRAVASLREATAVVELGGGTGVSGLWLLSGMAPRGVLTTIDPETEYQTVAAKAFRAAGIPSSRTRFINGRAADVLPRLAAHSYDMVVIDSEPKEAASLIENSIRILRPGGAIVLPNGLWFGNVADPARRDPQTVAAREALNWLNQTEGLTTTVLPLDNGIVLAVKTI